VSEWRGEAACNDFSIGIELEGSTETSYTPQQYSQLAGLITSLTECYPTLSLQNIVGHSDIAPERKTDPGPHFDWHELQQQLTALSSHAA